MQAKDLDDEETLGLVLAISIGEKERGFTATEKEAAEYWERNCRPDAWVFMSDLEKHLPAVPEKVLLAKMRALIRRGLLEGCACGCRGDFWVTELGRAFLGWPS